MDCSWQHWLPFEQQFAHSFQPKIMTKYVGIESAIDIHDYTLHSMLAQHNLDDGSTRSVVDGDGADADEVGDHFANNRATVGSWGDW